MDNARMHKWMHIPTLHWFAHCYIATCRWGIGRRGGFRFLRRPWSSSSGCQCHRFLITMLTILSLLSSRWSRVRRLTPNSGDCSRRTVTPGPAWEWMKVGGNPPLCRAVLNSCLVVDSNMSNISTASDSMDGLTQLTSKPEGEKVRKSSTGDTSFL